MDCATRQRNTTTHRQPAFSICVIRVQQQSFPEGLVDRAFCKPKPLVLLSTAPRQTNSIIIIISSYKQNKIFFFFQRAQPHRRVHDRRRLSCVALLMLYAVGNVHTWCVLLTASYKITPSYVLRQNILAPLYVVRFGYLNVTPPRTVVTVLVTLLFFYVDENLQCPRQRDPYNFTNRAHGIR